MQLSIRTILFITISACTGIFCSSCSVSEQKTEDIPDAYKKADIKQGGLLYDNWCKIMEVESLPTHKLYPKKGKKEGMSSNRCKECHGWDYKGKMGAYKEGSSHYTGIKGIYDARTKSPSELYNIITDKKTHDFLTPLGESNVWAVVKFVREGLIDTDLVVDKDGNVKGDGSKSSLQFTKSCSKCHGGNGGRRDFKKDLEGKQGVGWIARKNPQETLHKIRWGHPGTIAPSLLIDDKLTDTDIINLLKYCQTLEK